MYIPCTFKNTKFSWLAVNMDDHHATRHQQYLPTSVSIHNTVCCCCVWHLSLVFVYLRFGRKPVLFGSVALVSVFSGAQAFAPSWPVFTALYFMIGLGQLSGYVAVFVLGMCFSFWSCWNSWLSSSTPLVVNNSAVVLLLTSVESRWRTE